jgi:hypothetical protein
MLRGSRKSKKQLQASEASNLKTLQFQNRQNTKIRLSPNALRVVHGRLFIPGLAADNIR